MNERWARSATEPANQSNREREDGRPRQAAVAPTVQQIFAGARPPSDAVVVYKRRRLPAQTDETEADAASAENRERRPRVFQVAAPDAEAVPAAGGPEAADDAPAAAPRRRRRRRAQQAPGEVRHIVFERPSPPTAAAGSEAQAAWQALQALDRTLEQIRTAQRIKAALDELPF
ncbi:MAG: hypothetical protein QM750_04055 [Rubrivivax sp.]